MPLRRILTEHRAAIIPLAIVLVANLAAYGLVVYPLGVKSATAQSRSAQALAARRAAEADEAAARARVASREKAQQELGVFYGKVLPADLAAARRLTYTIPELAEKSDVRFLGHRWDDDPDKKSGLGHLKFRVELQGEYEQLRRFIYSVETAPEFVIIDGVTLAQADPNKPLTLTLDLSIYYRPNGA